MKLHLVGGAVRDHLLYHRTPADLDFAVEGDSYAEMEAWLVARGLHIWQARPEFVTIRGRIERSWLGDFGGIWQVASNTFVNADFTLCRAEAMYHDKRHPDVVTPASLAVDLSRRDFTVNAIAVSEDGEWSDPHNGREDLKNHILRVVGNPHDRFTEDPLRMLRALRFTAVMGLKPDSELFTWMRMQYITNEIRHLPHERVRDELNKALRADWQMTIMTLAHDYPQLGLALHRWFPNLWFKVTTEER